MLKFLNEMIGKMFELATTGNLVKGKATIVNAFKIMSKGIPKEKSKQTTSVVLEVLGMEDSFQKTFSDSEFIEIIEFPNKPKYGWAIHPIVLEVEHEEFGHVQIKTEIHEMNTPVPNIIYNPS